MSAGRDFDQQEAAVLRKLIDPTQFESEPLNRMDCLVEIFPSDPERV